MKFTAHLCFLFLALFYCIQLCIAERSGGVISLRIKKEHLHPVKEQYEHEHDIELSPEAKAAIHKANQPRKHTPNRERIPKERVKEYDYHKNEVHKATNNMHLSDRALKVARENFTGERRKENEERIYNARKKLHERVFFHGNAADVILRDAIKKSGQQQQQQQHSH
jgi:hypothetical protein